uniref:Plasmodium variant antigen protein Cir/Yir/Bir n=1 Tax=Strongyloides papillosus TaxID=174720 RepID=A0A0N5C4V3_STREA
MCIGGLFTGTSEDVKAELGKLGMKGHIKPKNTTDGLCNYRITNHANFTESDIKNSDIYVNYTYTSSHRNITKKIPDDCKDKDDYIQQDFDNKYHFLCNLGYLDPNPKNESENTTPVSGKYPSLLGNCGRCPK